MALGNEDQTKAQQARASEHEAKEQSWNHALMDPWARPGIQVEFVTSFGVRHLGRTITANAGLANDRYVFGQGPSEVLMMSESSEHPEYFSKYQLEKWRVTTEVAKKKRFVGRPDHASLVHIGLRTPVFVSYTMLRLSEKFAEDNFRGDVPMPFDTVHYKNEDNKSQWETKIYFCGKEVILVEIEDLETVDVLFDRHQQVGYDYKHVAHAAEHICKYLLNRDSA